MLPEPNASLRESLAHFAAIDQRGFETESTERDLDDWPQRQSGTPAALNVDVGPSAALEADQDADASMTESPPDAFDMGQPDEDEPPTLELVDEAGPSEPGDANAHRGAKPTERIDASMLELEAYLSRPPSEDELRAIRARGFGRTLRIAAVLAIGLMLGGTLIHWLRSDAEQERTIDASTPTIDMPALSSSASNPTLFANPDGLSTEPARAEPLARLRGPVVPGSTTNLREARPKSDPNHASPANPAAPDTH
jgi:hypothetical protein